MSQCFTVTQAGMVPGIAVTGTHMDQPSIAVGIEYDREETPDGYSAGSLRTVYNKVLFAHSAPPPVEDGRVMRARVVRVDGTTYLRRAEPADKGVLVYINTDHSSPCEIGGTWSVNDNQLARSVAYGRNGHMRYKLKSGDGLLADYIEHTDDNTCYDVGILLLLPGSCVTVRFNAPGALVGELTFDGGEPSFDITENAVDPYYVYDRPDYEFEQGIKRSPEYAGLLSGGSFDDDCFM